MNVTEQSKKESVDILDRDMINDIEACLSTFTDEEILAMFQKNEEKVAKIQKEMNAKSQKFIAYPRHPFR
jgi:hypothetical protein